MRSIIKYINEALFSSASEFSKADDIDDFVDLGLSVKWAKCNLGADEETDSGHYYMWGSTESNDNDNCCWKNTPFNNGNDDFDKDYFDSIKNKVCPNGKLAPKYDAAYQESNRDYLNRDYRMPTQAECDELIKNTDHKWIENYNKTGINGMKFTNKKDESKYIFIPAAGNRWDYSTDDNSNNALVWSASLYTRLENCSYGLYLSYNHIDTYSYDRSCGFVIRAVQDK